MLDGLQYWIGNLTILKGVFLAVSPGQVCGLFGRNGCGKSTLLKLAAGQLTPSSGSVFIDGERFHRPMLRRRFAHIAYLPQESMLPRRLRIRTMLRFLHALDEESADDEILSPILRCDRVGELSGGKLRLLELMFVLSLGRHYALLDEPFTGVEPILVERMLDEIRRYITQGKSVLVTDHEYPSVLEIADEAYLMRDRTCHHLDGNSGLREQLHSHGYL